MSENVKTENHRRSPRMAMEGDVKIRLSADVLEGPGQNLSKDGVYLIAEGDIVVEVLLPGESEYREGHLVRANLVREGALGLAIRFTS